MRGAGEKGREEGGEQPQGTGDRNVDMAPSSPNHRVPVHLLTLALPGQFPVLLVTIKPTSLT